MASRSPDVPMHWNTLGDVLMAAGRFAEAETALRAALARQPGFGAALERMEQVLFYLGRVDESVDFRVARLQATGQSTRADQLSDDAATLGGVEARRRDLQREVEMLLAEAAASDPLSPSWLRTTGDRLIVAYCALGDWANAMVWIERWYAKRPGRLRRVLMDLPINEKGPRDAASVPVGCCGWLGSRGCEGGRAQARHQRQGQLLPVDACSATADDREDPPVTSSGSSLAKGIGGGASPTTATAQMAIARCSTARLSAQLVEPSDALVRPVTEGEFYSDIASSLQIADEESLRYWRRERDSNPR